MRVQSRGTDLLFVCDGECVCVCARMTHVQSMDKKAILSMSVTLVTVMIYCRRLFHSIQTLGVAVAMCPMCDVR